MTGRLCLKDEGEATTPIPALPPEREGRYQSFASLGWMKDDPRSAGRPFTIHYSRFTPLQEQG